MHLVASSVPELSANDVTLVDQAGSLLNSPDESAEAAASTRHFEETRKLEESYQQRIIELLEPMLGPGRVRATVTADMDFTVTEETRENYDPQKTAVRSEQTSNEMRKGGDGAEGIPGALSNQPPGTSGAPVIPGAATPGNPADAAATRREPPPAGAASSGPSSSAQRSTRNFEVDRTLSYVKQPVGILKRLNVGVVLDDWQKVDADGKVTTAPMSDTDIKRFTQLVKESIGLKDDRGDQINVMNQAFKSNAALPPVDGLPLWQQPWLTAARQANRRRGPGAGGGVPGIAAADEIAHQAVEAIRGRRRRHRRRSPEPVGTGASPSSSRPVLSSRSRPREPWWDRIRGVQHRS